MNNLTPEQRIQYIFKTQNKPTEERIVEIIKILERDNSPIVRHEAAYTLGEIKHERTHTVLINTINSDPNRFVRHEAALALGNTGIMEGMETLKELCSDPDKDVADTAIISVQRMEMKKKQVTLASLGLNPADVILDLEETWENRIQAAFLLMEEGSENSVNTLIKALNQETNGIVKHEIVFSLGETASKVAMKALVDCLSNKDENDFVVHEILLALATLGYKETEAIIREFTKHEVPEIAETAEIALERLLND